MKKRAVLTKHDQLSLLLGQYGNSLITSEQFLAQMAMRGYSQNDIDEWCVEDRKRSEENAEQDKAEQGRPQGSRHARDARGKGREP